MQTSPAASRPSPATFGAAPDGQKDRIGRDRKTQFIVGDVKQFFAIRMRCPEDLRLEAGFHAIRGQGA